MWGYIYKVTCLYQDPKYYGKIYVGQHARSRFVPTYKGSGTLIKELRRQLGDGWFKVELIDRCKDQQELDLKEEYWIEKLQSRNPQIGLNQSKGGRANDAKHEYRKDSMAKELRESAKAHDPEHIRKSRLADGSNWIIIEKDGRQREVFVDKVQYYLDRGWQLYKK